VSNSYKTSFKPALIVSAIYFFLALPVPTPLGTGGLIIWTPFVGIAAYFAHNMLRWIIR
jgi:hypothetical protein